ncbi:MAG: hypothetical protein ACREET_11670 [Stellaceae bacterium]
MFYRVLIGLIFVTAVTVPSPSQAAPPFQYLIDAANQIKQIEYSKAALNEDDNGRIAKIACGTLSQLVDDANFKKALSDMLSEKSFGSLRSPAYGLIENLAEFNRTFLPAELENLRRAGLDYPAVFDVLQIASRGRTRANLKELSAVDVLQKITSGREAVCKLAAGIVSERDRKAAEWTFGGVTLVVVDVASAIGIASVSGGALAVAAGAVAATSIDIGANAAVSGLKGDIP